MSSFFSLFRTSWTEGQSPFSFKKNLNWTASFVYTVILDCINSEINLSSFVTISRNEIQLFIFIIFIFEKPKNVE